MRADPVLEARGLTRHFRIGGLRGHTLHAVDDLDMGIAEREIVALVGESGSGKSTVARLLAMVYRPTSGEILFRGRPVSSLRRRRQVLAYRGQVPMVFQDPFSSLNPAHTIGYALVRGLKLHRPELDRRQRQAEAERVLAVAGLVPPAFIMSKYPYELSGGQRQRVGFAAALSYRPKLILADEPVSMLDVSIRIGLLNVMARLREEEKVSLLYITHDIASARYLSDRILVMYAGHLVEQGPTDDVLHNPVHPYTRLLLVGRARPPSRDVGHLGGRGRAAPGDRSRGGLPVPLALPPRHRCLRRGDPPAAPRLPGPRGGLPRHRPRLGPARRRRGQADDGDGQVISFGSVFLEIVFGHLERLPLPGEEIYVDPFAFSCGGAVTIAVAASRAGATAGLATVLGDDLGSRVVTQHSLCEGVDLSPSRRVTGPAVGITVVLNFNRDRAFVSHMPPRPPGLAPEVERWLEVLQRVRPAWCYLHASARRGGLLARRRVPWAPG